MALEPILRVVEAQLLEGMLWIKAYNVAMECIG